MMCGYFCTNRKKSSKQKTHTQQAGRILIFRRLSAVVDYTENGLPSLNVYQQMLATSFSWGVVISIHLILSQITILWPMSGVYSFCLLSCGQSKMNYSTKEDSHYY